MTLFPPELRTLAIIPRWCIVMTTLKDNVATHSYYVAVYARMIAKVIGWQGSMDYLFMNALLHDNDESITGDITGPVKNHIIDEDRATGLLEELTEQRMGGLIQTFYDMEDELTPLQIEEASKIVMVADKLDALLFLLMNERMGNTMVIPAIEGGTRSLEAAWRALPAPKDLLDREWQTTMYKVILDHQQRGARGCAPGVTI